MNCLAYLSVRHLAVFLLVLAAATSVIAQERTTDKRPAWTTSRIQGSPLPPPPYRLAPAFPNLKFEKPTCVEEFPGEQRLLVTEIGGKILSFPMQADVRQADFVVDARFLPNPFWEPDLRDLTGCESPVSAFVLSQNGAEDFITTVTQLINSTIPGFEREGKRYLTVAVGCTGGKHRSVAIAEELARRLRSGRISAGAQHRDLGRE